ncbi:hypothetical protein AB0M48_19675 [Lentzea sp. NPDC051208]|uniref:hypothetical protein n=1 Tax=Lentzea sp. NPDC051208 TaxID=3154642 RepID=UPI0034277389
MSKVWESCETRTRAEAHDRDRGRDDPDADGIDVYAEAGGHEAVRAGQNFMIGTSTLTDPAPRTHGQAVPDSSVPPGTVDGR